MSKPKELRMSDAWYDQIQVLRYVLDDLRRENPQACSRAIARTMLNEIRLGIEEMTERIGKEKP